MHKVSSRYLDLLKQEERFGLHFWRLNDVQKCKINVFSGKKQTSKLRLAYFEVKLQQIGASPAFSNKTGNKQQK